MSLATLLLVVVAAQSPLKLSHTYVVDESSTFALEAKMAEFSMEITGDVVFKVLDADGNHTVSCSNGLVKGGGQETPAEFKIDKLKIDKHGLAEKLHFGGMENMVVFPTIMGYLPAAELEKDKAFEIKEKRSNYTMEGTGKLLAVSENEGKQLAKIEYKVTVTPVGQEANDPRELTFTSTFDAKTSKLLSSDGKAVIGGRTAELKVKRK